MPVAFDMKDGLLAPEFMDVFYVIRRVQSVDSGGIASFTESLPIRAKGIVLPFTPDSLRRETDIQYEYKALSITTSFILRGPSTTPNTNNVNAPDIIIWNKDKYVVTALDDYSNYNPGFVKVTAVSLDYVDTAPQGINT